MPQSQARPQLLMDTALAVALVPVLLLPQLVGGVHPHVATAAAVFELVALTLLLVDRVRRRRPLHVSWLGAPLMLGLVVTLGQLVPLPMAVRLWLQPAGTKSVAFVIALLPEAARGLVWPSLSLDPPETAFAAVRLLGAVCLFVVVTEACRHARARSFTHRVLLVAGALLFLVALGHALFRASGAWGMFMRYNGVFFAPLVNPNHLARIFGGLGFVLVARTLVVKSRAEAVAFGGIGVACLAGVFLTLSRGGIIAFVGAAVVLLLLVLRERGVVAVQGERGDRGGAVVPLLVAGALGTALWVAYGAITRELATLSGATLESSKAALYRPALSLLKDYPFVGAGNSTFGVAFAVKADPSVLGGGNTFTHVENIVVQTLVDHGPLLGGALLLVALAVAYRLLASLKSRAFFAPVAALAFLVFGDLFDFALEHAAGLYLAATLLALAAAPFVEAASHRGKVRGKGTRQLSVKGAAIIAGALAVVGVLCAVLAIAGWRRSLDDELAGAPVDQRTALLHRAVALHPQDAQYCYLLSVEGRRARNPQEALRWANAALVLWPALPGAHVEAARALVVLGHLEQAMLEYKTAWVAGGNGKRLLDEIVQRTSDASLRRSAVPDEIVPLALLCRVLVTEKRLDDAQSCADEIAARADAREEDVRLALEVALLRADTAGASARLQTLAQGGALDGETAAAAARATELVEGLAVARMQAHRWSERQKRPGPLLEWRLDAALRAAPADIDEARTLLQKLRATSKSAASTERLDRLEASLHRRAGEHGKARIVLMRLLDRKPRDVALIAELGLLELELGQSVQARVQYERAARINREHPLVKSLADRLRLPAPRP